MFFGVIETRQKCHRCGVTLYYFDNYKYLTFPLYNFKNKKFNLYQGFKEYIESKSVNLYCNYCKSYVKVREISMIYDLSVYLIIILDYGKAKKDKPSQIQFGEVIDLVDFVDKSNYSTNYELISTISFINDDNYIYYYKDKACKWYSFNNTTHTESNFKEVWCYAPYILIYQKENNKKS